jgi:hypothetical protein
MGLDLGRCVNAAFKGPVPGTKFVKHAVQKKTILWMSNVSAKVVRQTLVYRQTMRSEVLLSGWLNFHHCFSHY